jgi:GT2 family glycosyltransferase
VHSDRNIGVNAVAETVKLAKGFYLIEMDDDVLKVPKGWLKEMIRVFNKVPNAGYLAANVVQNELTNGAKPPAECYQVVDYGDGVVIEHGPTGGWCTITSREVIEKIGNFLQIPGKIFFSEDGDFVNRCTLGGYNVGIIRNVVVFHATGLEMNKKYGCLDVCKLKYSDDPAYKPLLEATLREIEKETS